MTISFIMIIPLCDTILKYKQSQTQHFSIMHQFATCFFNQTLLLFWDYTHKTKTGAENNKQIQNKTEHRGLFLGQHILWIDFGSTYSLD